MCTAVAYRPNNFYFGRTLDFEFLYPCEVVFTPREFPFDFRFSNSLKNHYAILGMACVMDNYPLYFDAVNEKGLCMAGLNFVGNAVYRKETEGKENVASFEFIPYILSKCESVKEARCLLENINITDTAFKEDLLPSQLHWIVADKEESVVVESIAKGVMVYPNPVGVLTNNPPFEYQLENLRKYNHLHAEQGAGATQEKEYSEFSRGTGAVGLPGDYTSKSRFVRAAFLCRNSHCGDTEVEGVNQFFHVLSGVSVPEGCCVTEKGEYDKTLYASCMSTQKGIYYYKAYESQGVYAVDMKKGNIDGADLVRYPFRTDAPITFIN